MDLLEASNLSPDEEFDHWWVMTRFHSRWSDHTPHYDNGRQ